MKRIVSSLLLLFCLPIFAVGSALAVPPDFVPTPAQNEKIVEIAETGLVPAFEELKAVPFLLNDDLLEYTAFEAFDHRRDAALELAANRLHRSRQEVDEGRITYRTKDLYVAKTVLNAFPEQAAGLLVAMYNQSDPVTRGNIIYAAGEMAKDHPAVRNLLLGALDDTREAEVVTPETLGLPLRICDLAYNQLVLHLQVEDVLRSIGTSHSLEIRDRQISQLDRKISAQAAP